MSRQQALYVQTVSTVAGNQVLKTDFPIGTIVINNTTDAKFKIYFGEISLGIGTNLFDYTVDGYTFARLPIHSRTTKITIEWTGTTKQFDVIRFDLIEEKMDMHIQANPPMTGGVGLAQNVTVANALPAGTATIGKVNIGTSDIDISKNGASIAGETLSAGGSDSLGWLSEIAKRIKTVLTVSINAGANTIGKVDLNAGANTIGKVDLNAGANIIGKVDINTIPNVTLNPLPSGANKIGKVDSDNTPQAMTVSPITKQIALVASTITPLRVGASDLANRKQIVLKNIDPANTVYIGDSAVSATNGFPLDPKSSMSFDQNPNNIVPVYAFSANALTVAVMEVG